MACWPRLPGGGPRWCPPLRSPGSAPPAPTLPEKQPSPATRRWTPWVKLIRRVFLIDALACPRCPGRVRVIAVVMRKSAIESILKHVGLASDVSSSNPPRGPPHDAVAGSEPPDAVDCLPERRVSSLNAGSDRVVRPRICPPTPRTIRSGSLFSPGGGVGGHPERGRRTGAGRGGS